MRNKGTLIFKGFIHLSLIIWAIISVFPLVWMISTSLKQRNEIFTNRGLIPKNALNFANYKDAWFQGDFNVYTFNSALYSVIVVGCVVLFASLASYGIARLDMAGKKAIFLGFMATLMIPIPGAFISIYIVVSNLGLANTRIGYILPLIASALPVSIFILKTFFDEMSRELEEAAVIDGATSFQIYYKVMLPIARPALATIVILNTLSVWNEFMLALVLFSENKLMPIQMGLSVFVGQYTTQYELLMAASTIMVLPVILVYIAMQKQFIQGITSGAIKG
ncbi:carbohydrate ABC transporter permease [Paenibacillus sp. GCM10027626]|uniref:carbohydrate ABC transporter permease n=1 Tax=Paenibacillus sp. GCM10027626 TaxID=3273411 RepID=UPI0036299559